MATTSTPNASRPSAGASRSALAARVGRLARVGLLAVSLAAVELLGCAISPKPEPPMDPGVQVDLGQVETIPANGFGPWLVAGGPGAASPAGAELHVVNLEDDSDPVLGVVAADGSFEVEILADAGDEVRLQLVTDTLRSAPVDFLVGELSGSVLPATRPLSDCLTLTPALELDTALGTTLTVHNGCAESLQLEAPTLRRAAAGIDVSPATGWPTTLAAGQMVTLTISFVAPAGTLEEVLFVRASASQNDRRPITVWPVTQ